MDTDKIEGRLSAILPDAPRLPNMAGVDTQKAAIIKEAASIKRREEAKDLAYIKYKEKQNLKRAENGYINAAQAARIKEHKKKIETIEAIEAGTVDPLDVKEVGKRIGADKKIINKALQLQGAARPEIMKLLAGLNINLSVRLTKADTANLLACLLTCNESQLSALMSNKKVPVVIKTVIKRLLEDMRLGNIDTIEKLWDRVFGKGQMLLELPDAQQAQTGILPNVPISREAYIVIRENLIK